jgi:hypothetical protein
MQTYAGGPYNVSTTSQNTPAKPIESSQPKKLERPPTTLPSKPEHGRHFFDEVLRFVKAVEPLLIKLPSLLDGSGCKYTSGERTVKPSAQFTQQYPLLYEAVHAACQVSNLLLTYKRNNYG